MRPMEPLEIGDRVRGTRSDFGLEGTVVEIRTHYNVRGKDRPYLLPLILVRYDNGGERWGSLSRWEKV